MMTLEEFQRVVSSVKCRGWDISAHVINDQYEIRVSGFVLDSAEALAGVSEPRVIQVMTRTALHPATLTGDNLIDFIWFAVRQTEEHECGEWFIVDGQRPYYPHSNGVR